MFLMVVFLFVFLSFGSIFWYVIFLIVGCYVCCEGICKLYEIFLS